MKEEKQENILVIFHFNGFHFFPSTSQHTHNVTIPITKYPGTIFIRREKGPGQGRGGAWGCVFKKEGS